jgi:uncharacterized protein
MSASTTERLVRFARELRSAGVRVGSGQVIAFRDAIAVLHPVDVADLYWAGRATLVTRTADLQVYDEVFAGVFGRDDRSAMPARPCSR